MYKQAIFEAWAPLDGAWSAWAKPVLFAHLPRRLPTLGDWPAPDVSWLPPFSPARAIVVELPGVRSVAMGLALAEAGYRPVPLFNACPPPEVDEEFASGEKAEKTDPSPLALVEVDSILAALLQGAGWLRDLGLPADAPPAFLLDAARGGSSGPGTPGSWRFDNRSVVFDTDVPSTQALITRGIDEVAVIVERDGPFQTDLDHVLRTWSRGGLALSLKALDRAGPRRPLRLRRPNPLSGLWIRLKAWAGLHRGGHGGFGGFVLESAGG
jgi:hypothetical protein